MTFYVFSEASCPEPVCSHCPTRKHGVAKHQLATLPEGPEERVVAQIHYFEPRPKSWVPTTNVSVSSLRALVPAKPAE